MAVRVDSVEPLAPGELEAWRRKPRQVPVWRPPTPAVRPGGRDDDPEPTIPMSEEDGIVDGDVVAFNPPVKPGIRPARETVQEVARRWVAWCKENREWFEARATLLKQTSPTQFGHLTVGQLADHLSEFAVEKAKAAVAETYARNGWLKPENLDLTNADPAPSLYLPGQTGRREEG